MTNLEKQVERVEKTIDVLKSMAFNGENFEVQELFNTLDLSLKIMKELLPKAVKYNKFQLEIADKEFYQKLSAQNGEVGRQLFAKLDKIKAEINDQEPELALVKINAILKQKLKL